MLQSKMSGMFFLGHSVFYYKLSVSSGLRLVKKMATKSPLKSPLHPTRDAIGYTPLLNYRLKYWYPRTRPIFDIWT